MLDSKEYLHLAINASQSNDHHAAMEYLHKCLALEPKNAEAIFLLAAEHAQIGLYDRAVEGLKEALKLEPGLELASFQLAILRLQSDDSAESVEILTELLARTKNEALQLFCEGLILLVKEDYDTAQAKLTLGIEKNKVNPALNSTIEALLGFVRQATEEKLEPATEANADEAEPSAAVFLGAYKNQRLSD